MSDKIIDFLNRVANELGNKQVRIGFVEGETYPDGTSVASVAAQNEYGDPSKRIPARPFFRNAISNNQDAWKDTISRGIRAGAPVDQVLEVVGALAASDVYVSITQLMDPALSARTIRERQERGNMSTKPLEDTKVMLNSIKYQVSDIDSEEEQ